MTSRAIVVPLDASEQALAAVPVARQLAELGGGTLHFVHVTPESTVATDIVAKVGLAVGDLRGSIVDAQAGEPAAGIVRTARALDAALIVMSTHKRTLAPENALGSIALAVLTAAPCPVVLVRPERGLGPWALRRVLVPHDGATATSEAMPPAAKLASAARAEIEVLHVAACSGRAPDGGGSFTPPRYVDQPQHEWPSWAGEFIERLGGACPLGSLKVGMSLGTGAPADEVLRVAAEHASDLIVLAWRGAWDAGRAATIKSVVSHAGCPVMIVPAKHA